MTQNLSLSYGKQLYAPKYLEQNETVATEREFLHDLLNPMAVIEGRLNLLKKKLDQMQVDEKIKSDVEKICQAYKKAFDLIDRRRSHLKNQP